jgi:transposase-like protein
MDFTQEQISEIITKIATQEGGFRKVMTLTLEGLMKAERALWNATQSDVSNGFRPRRVFGDGRMLELRVPRSRNGNFYPMLLATLKDQQEEAQKLVYQLYRQGLTTEQIGETFELIYGKHYSSSQVSYLMQEARAELQYWMQRALESYYPIIYIDAVHIYARRGESVSKEAFYTILGVKQDTTREVLAISNSPNENATVWQQVFNDLKARGVQHVGLVVSDQLAGIDTAVSQCFGTRHQLCTVHLTRNLTNQVKPKDKAELIRDLQAVFEPEDAQKTPEQAHEQFIQVVEKWKINYPSFARYQAAIYRLYFTYFDFHPSIRRMIYTTNWIERLNRDYRRVIKMRASLPNPDAVLFLLGSVAKHQKAYQFQVSKLKIEEKLFNISNN